MCRDHEHGLIPGWPDRYSARAVQAVRFLMRESEACTAELMQR